MKKKLLFLVSLFVLMALLAGCGPKPDEIALQLADAVNAKDLETALDLFAEDAVVTSVSPEPFAGKVAIQGWLEGMIADNFQLEAEILEVNGNLVTERDTMSMDSMSFYGIDTLTGIGETIVENGKIKALNFSFSEETLADLQAAPFVALEDLIGIWSVGTMIKFNEDGTLRVGRALADLDLPPSEEHPGAVEAWTYDGMVVTFQVVESDGGEDYPCTPDQMGAYFVKWAGDDLDRLKFKTVHEDCGTRRGGMLWGNWSSVLP